MHFILSVHIALGICEFIEILVNVQVTVHVNNRQCIVQFKANGQNINVWLIYKVQDE